MRSPLILFALVATLATNLNAQSTEELRRLYPWVDTTGESGVYPVGDAIDVYRAALDLLYKDGNKRPSVIVIHDTIEIGGEKPCPVKCDYVWHHKSKMDTTTILAFGRQSPKRPRFKPFVYDIPIALVSYDDRNRMEADGAEYLAAHNLPNDMTGRALAVGFSQNFPGAWGLAQFGKVGFNTQHTEALVQVRHSCFATCGSDEALFLRRVKGHWMVIERIPTYSETSLGYGNLRYRGPAGSDPSESELIADPGGRRVPRSEATDAEAVYRAVLDSLYSFQGDSPRMVVLTDRLRAAANSLPAPKTPLDQGMLQKYASTGATRTTPDPGFRYRLPVAIVLGDSISRIDKIGVPLTQPGDLRTFWFGFRKEYPSAWGMVSFTRVAFNVPHTQAIVYSYHQCGDYCGNGDTWVLLRSGERWRVAERIARETLDDWDPELFPLRHVSLAAKPNAYHHRHAYARFINAVTNQPLSHLQLIAYHKGDRSDATKVSTDAKGRIDLGTIPFTGIIGMSLSCPDQLQKDSIYALEFIYSAGSDTTVTSRVDFRQCLRTSQPQGLIGAQAFIGGDSARFVFPYRPASETWAVPFRRTSPGTTNYQWVVDWFSRSAPDGAVVTLILNASQKSDSLVGSLAELIRRHPLEPVMYCARCDGFSLYSWPGHGSPGFSAKVEGEKLVFTLTGRDAVRETFPITPDLVTFRTAFSHSLAGKKESWRKEETQTVIVNCRSSDSTGYSRRRCNAPTNARFAKPVFDSTAPRRVRVVALSYDGGSLMRNLDVRIRSEDRREPAVTKSTGSGGYFFTAQSRDSVTIDALCPGASGDRSVSGRLALYIGPGRDTTLQLLVDPRRCPR